MEFLGLGATLAGSPMGGLFGETVRRRMTLFFGAFGTLLSALWLVFSPVRAVRDAPASLVEHGR